MKNEKDTKRAINLWEGSNARLQNEIMDRGTQKTDGSLLSVCSLFPAWEYTIYVCLLLAAHWTHLLTLGTWKCVPTRQQEDGLYTGKALAVQSEQAEEAPFMECAQAVGSTLPGRPEQEFWGQTTWFEYWPTTTYGGNPDSLWASVS